MNVLGNNYTEIYENIITLGGFNMTVENPQLNVSCNYTACPTLSMKQTVFNHMTQPALRTF